MLSKLNWILLIVLEFLVVVVLISILKPNILLLLTKHGSISTQKFSRYFEDSGIERIAYTNGVSWVDFNNDGSDDLFFATSSKGARLFMNSKGKFIDVTPKSLTFGRNTYSGVFADYDNDGCKDLFTTGRRRNDSLFKGNCKGGFTDISKEARVDRTTGGIGAAWADYNNDGYLDLYIAAHSTIDNNRQYIYMPNVLYKNNKDGTFTDVAKDAGVLGSTKCLNIVKPHYYDPKPSFQPTWFDYNNDGLQDLFVATDFGVSPLFENRGDGTFEDVTKKSGLCKSGTGMGVTVGDYNNDGHQDIYVTNFFKNYLWKNRGNGSFDMIADETSTGDDESIGWGTGFFDYNNDGYLDLYVTNGSVDSLPRALASYESYKVGVSMKDKVFLNKEGKVFNEVAQGVGVDADVMKIASAFSDFNNDGLTDIIVTANRSEDLGPIFYKNGGNSNNWISIKLIGTKSNRDSIGAKIIITTNDKKQMREIQAGSSFLSQNSLWQTVGVGKNEIIDKIEVIWPSGQKKTLLNIKPNRKLVIEEMK